MKNNLKQGLKENWKQFTLLVIVNAFVGGMIGMERTIFPQFAEVEFDVISKTAIFSFIIAFGITKAIANYFTGRLANYFGRKKLLVAGWMIAIPIPFILIYAPSWNWVIFANVLLGLSQGMSWSSTVVMKIDLVGEKERGFAMGLNEFAGYVAVGLVALISGYVAHRYGITPYPFYIGIFISIVGFLLSLIWVKDTEHFVRNEGLNKGVVHMENVFIETTFKNKTLSAVTQAGLVNNLNDGMIWGLLPVILFSLNFNNGQLGIITAVYPTVWGISQLFTGKMSDHYSKKAMLIWGMLLQGVAILCIPFLHSFSEFVVISFFLGLGTALVYPTFLSTIAQATSPQQRAESIGAFRLWRDLGYAFGALISGITADVFGVEYAVFLIGGLTVISSFIVKIRMPNEIKTSKECIEPDEVRSAMQASKRIQIIDVRSKEEFQEENIPSAMNIPLPELNGYAPQLKKDLQYVVVCGKGGGRSANGASLLQQHGLNAIWLCGGSNKWLNSAA
jgi:MFS family permease